MVVAPMAFAADAKAPQTQTQTAAPLPPGNAAGVRQAQGFQDVPIEFWIGGALVLAFAVWAVMQDDDDDITTTTTSTTAP
jgi:hypothetical protein